MKTKTIKTKARYLVAVSVDNKLDVKRKKGFYGFSRPSLKIFLNEDLFLEAKLPITYLNQYKYTIYLFSAKGNINILEGKDEYFSIRERYHIWDFREDFENDGENILFLILEESPDWILPETKKPIKHRDIINQHQAIDYNIELDVASLISRVFLIEAQDFKTINFLLSRNKKSLLTKKIKYLINNMIIKIIQGEKP